MKNFKNTDSSIFRIVFYSCATVLALLLIAIIVPEDWLGHSGCIGGQSAKYSLQGVQASLELYYTHYERYPENLKVLIEEGYLSENGAKDLWGNPYKYERNSDKNNYKLGSSGPDGKFDTSDDIEPPINTANHTFKPTPSPDDGATTDDTPVE